MARTVAIHVEDDDEPVVDARPPDAPRVHDREGISPRGLGGDLVVVAGPGDDRHLGLRPLLDPVGDRLGSHDRGPVPDAREVIDVHAGQVLRERSETSAGNRRVRLDALGDVHQTHEQRRVQVAGLGQREHVLVDDRRRGPDGHRRGQQAGACVQVDLAMFRAALVHIEQHDQPIIDPRTAHAPCVHDRLCVCARRLGRDIRVRVLDRDRRDLGMRLEPDRIDDLLGVGLRRGVPDVGEVVDVHAVLRGRERHVGERDRGRKGCAEGQGAEERDESADGHGGHGHSR